LRFHSERLKGAKNLLLTPEKQILRSAQDDTYFVGLVVITPVPQQLLLRFIKNSRGFSLGLTGLQAARAGHRSLYLSHPNLHLTGEKGTAMTSIQRFTILGLSVLSSFAIGQQTAPNNPPPGTAHTTATRDSTATNASGNSAPMTAKEKKEQQKQQEKIAKENAKAAKHHANAMKAQAKALKEEHKSADAAEKAKSGEKANSAEKSSASQ
jgi:hypothetical protein